MRNNLLGRELVPVSKSADNIERVGGLSLNPATFLKRVAERKKEDQERRLSELTNQVVGKLLGGIAEKGMVSVFNVIESGELATEIYSVFFTSPEIPRLRVELWRDHIKPSDEKIATELRFYGVKPLRLHISADNDSNHMAAAVVNRWGNPENEFELIYRRSAMEEATNRVIPRAISEKIAFLEQIMATEVDEVAIAKKFGAPYSPGATWSSNSPLSDERVHHAYWVRDVLGELGFPELQAAQAELVGPAT